LIGGNVIWRDENGHTVAGLEYSHAEPISIPMVRSYITSSSEIAICYTGGDQKPLLYFETESDGLVTQGIEPYEITHGADNNIAHYKYRTINESLKSAGITNPSQLSKIVIVSEGPDLSILEVDVLSLNSTASYFAGGQSFNTEKGVTLLPGLKVLGWYTTKDYRDGTEFTGEAFKDMTLYGKVFWEEDKVALAKYEEKYGAEDPDTIIDVDTGDTVNTDTEDKNGNNTNTDNNNSDNNSDNNNNSADNSSIDTGSNTSDNGNEVNTDSASANDSSTADNDNSSFPVIPVIIIILAIAAIAAGVAAFTITKKKK
jgi:hypothetical protein